MSFAVQSIWTSLLSPMLQRPKRLQVAALCHRGDGDEREYLLITSRDTGRWIIPKGWPIRGLNSGETAQHEAWEEAGVKMSEVANSPLGSYTYEKRQDTGWAFPVETLVFSVAVKGLVKDFPEADQRTRKWVQAEVAANLVNEPELKSIFRSQQ